MFTNLLTALRATWEAFLRWFVPSRPPSAPAEVTTFVADGALPNRDRKSTNWEQPAPAVTPLPAALADRRKRRSSDDWQ